LHKQGNRQADLNQVLLGFHKIGEINHASLQ
jgi:hypothetical protein